MEIGQKITQKSNSINELASHKLSIQLSLNGLSFCALNHITKTFEYYKTITFEKKLTPAEVLKEIVFIFNSEVFLKQPFESITVIHENELSTLVPKPLFDENYIADYLKFNSKILKTDYIAYDNLFVNDSVNVYVPYVNINNYFYDLFGAFEFKHVSSIVVETILSLEKHATTKKVYLNVFKTHFQIIALDKNELLLYNAFEYNTEEDFIYYLLFTLEQLTLNPEQIKVVLMGDISETDKIYDVTYTYIKELSIFQQQHKFKLNDTIAPSIFNNIALTNSF